MYQNTEDNNDKVSTPEEQYLDTNTKQQGNKAKNDYETPQFCSKQHKA